MSKVKQCELNVIILGQYLAISWRRYKIGPWLLWNVDRKSWYPIDRCRFRRRWV